MKLKSIKLLSLLLVSLLGFGLLSVNPVFAANDVCQSSADDQIKAAAGCPGQGTGDKLPGLIQAILNSIIAIAGTVAVIYVVIGGIKYMTSSGDAGKTQKAKETIIYAAIGIAICALAFAIVNWVISIIP